MKNVEKIEVLHFGYTENLGGVEMFIANINRYSKNNISVAVTTNAKIPFQDEFISKGNSVYRFHSRKSSPICYLISLFKLFRENKNIQVVHLNVNVMSSIAPIVIGKLFGKKCVIHAHNSDTVYPFYTECFHRINKRFYSFFTDYRLACSNKAGEYMFGKRQFKVINNGINTEKFLFTNVGRKKIRTEFNINVSDFLICHIGNYSPIKNQLFLLRVFKVILKQKKNSYLVLVGDGPDRETIMNYISDNALNENVFLTGRRNDIPDLLSASDCFVFPSLFEGLPFTLVEAQANGIPIVCSDNVSKESDITGLIKFKSLDDSLNSWADEIINSKNTSNRSNYCKIVKENGYDVFESVNKLDSVYYSLF